MDSSYEFAEGAQAESAERGESVAREWFGSENMNPIMSTMLSDLIAYGDRCISNALAVGEKPETSAAVVVAAFQLGLQAARELYGVDDQ